MNSQLQSAYDVCVCVYVYIIIALYTRAHA